MPCSEISAEIKGKVKINEVYELYVRVAQKK
jgi:hypothetical protein